LRAFYSYSIFVNEIKSDPEKAYQVGKEAFDEAISGLDTTE